MKMIKFIRNKAGDMGIGAMIVFIAMVLVAGIAASVLVQTANKLEIKAMTTGQQTTKEVSTGLHVIDMEGMVVTAGKISLLTVTIQSRAGSSDIDLAQTVVEISDGTTKTVLSFDTTDTDNYATTIDASGSLFGTTLWTTDSEHFGIIVLNDADGSMGTITSPVINRGDLVMLTINTDNCFGGLDPRDNIQGQIMPELGSPGIFAFRVPASLPDVVYDLY